MSGEYSISMNNAGGIGDKITNANQEQPPKKKFWEDNPGWFADAVKAVNININNQATRA